MSVSLEKTNDLITNICAQISNFEFVHSSNVNPFEASGSTTRIYDPFDMPDTNDDISEIDCRKTNDANLRMKQSVGSTNIIKCSDCDIVMYKSSRGMYYECEKCGIIEDDIGNDFDVVAFDGAGNGNFDVINNYNTSNTSAAPIRISGPNNYIYQKKLVSNTCNYSKTQKKNTIDQMLNFVYQHKSVPDKNIVLEAANFYYDVQQHCIKRGDVRKGTMAACLYRVCISHGSTRKPKEISDIFGVQQSEFSNGEKILDDLVASGKIKMKCNGAFVPDSDIKLANAFLNRYFENLNIPNDAEDFNSKDRPNYKLFTLSLIKFTQKYRIAESSIMSSKCAGAIYILALKRKELNITRDMIEAECSISKSTFSRFHKAVFTVLESDDTINKKTKSRLRNLLKKYQIII